MYTRFHLTVEKLRARSLLWKDFKNRWFNDLLFINSWNIFTVHIPINQYRMGENLNNVDFYLGVHTMLRMFEMYIESHVK